MTKYILGIDAGATKTVSYIADGAGKILGKSTAGPANISIQNAQEVSEVVRSSVEGAVNEYGSEILEFDAVCFGGAGVNTEESKDKARRAVLAAVKIKDQSNLLVVNDTQLILPTCSDKTFGISVIAGTGSNFYGVNKKGEEAWAGGLDWLLSDEGSAYWIGRKALRAVVKASDGRGEKTLIEELVLHKFSARSVRELSDIVYRENFGKTDIASLAGIVSQAYGSGDKVAGGILQAAAHEIALGINAVTEHLGMAEEEFDVVAVGGVFLSPFPFEKKITEGLIAKKLKFIICKEDTAFGAVRLALRQLNQRLVISD